ncbi:hypothetical protein [Actinocrispum sp. NPDC049592]|uniref:hypothetical protein n=1 Tax=Actinocrispum sp. NPDC049592 TaxID=3154835 RepID=UPI00343B4DF3
MGLTGRLLGVVLVLGGVVACDPKPPPPAAPPPVDSPAQPVYSYATGSGLRVMRGASQVAQVPAEVVSDGEWAADGSRFVAATSTELVSVDAKSGAVARAACKCTSIAVAAGRVFAGNYGDQEVAVFDAATLRPGPKVPLDHKMSRVDGAGDRVVLFLITATGARDETDVVVLDPANGSRTKVGSAIGVVDAAFTPRNWQGRQAFAYAVNGSTGASTGVASVYWFDPTTSGQQVETDDKPLRATSPEVAADAWNSGRDHLWWAADGSLHVTAWTWTCTSSDPLRPNDRCAEKVPHTPWKFDGSAWSQVDSRKYESVRDIGGGSTVEHSVQSNGKGSPLGLVEKGQRTVLDRDVRNVWTPPQRSAAPPNTGDQDMAVRLAPMVWLHPDEPDFPMSTVDFVHKSALWFDHGANVCRDGDPVATQLDETKLGRGEYKHTSVVTPGEDGFCLHDEGGKKVQTDQPVGQGTGWYLDIDDNALHGDKPGADRQVNAPVYWQYLDGGDGRRGAYLYWFFYGNDTYPPGSHEGDWERIAVQVTDGKPTGVAFWKHEAPACRLDWGNLETADGHPVVFSAKGGHGSYGRESTYSVYDGTQWGTDETGKGFAWNTSRDVVSVKEQPWYTYHGHWGKRTAFDLTSGKTGPIDKHNLETAFTDTKCSPGLPPGFARTWNSTQPVTDPAHPKEYRVHVELTPTKLIEQRANVFYPGFGCDGQWELTDSTPDKATFRETRRPSTDVRCVGTATVELTKTPTGLHYTRTDDNQSVVATAELSPE